MITLAGVNLSLLDTDGELQQWLDLYLAVEELVDQTEPIGRAADNRSGSQSGFIAPTHLPIPNYPVTQRPKLNCLYWPTGASRWARGYYLASQSQIDKILASAGSSNNAVTLKLDDEAGHTLSIQVYVLQPRPISAAEQDERTEQVYIVPVVDDRFYWQYASSGNLVIDEFSVWSDLYDLIGTQLGITIDWDLPDEDYQFPDIRELTRRYQNAAVLLDAVAHSVGQRIIVLIDGRVYAAGTEQTQADLAENFSEYQLIMGDKIELNPNAVIPEKVVVTFVKWRECQADPNGDRYAITVNNPDGGGSYMKKVIHSTAFADFTTKSGVPDNQTDCQTLANVIARDYWALMTKRDFARAHDLTIPSLFNWIPTAYDDHIEFCFGAIANGRYQAYTRVQSISANFGVEEQLSQFEEMPVYNKLARVQLTANLNYGGNAAAKFLSDDTDGSTLTSDTLRIYDSLSRTSGGIGQKLWAEYKNDTLRWEVSTDPNLIWHATLGTGVSPGASVSVTLPDGRTVTAVNHTEATFSSGDRVTVYQDQTNGVFYLAGGGGGGGSDGTVILEVTSSVDDSDCVWSGKVKVFAYSSPTTQPFCSNPFVDDQDCYIVVLNPENGSAAQPSVNKTFLKVGDRYLGQWIADWDNGDDTVTPVYGIRHDTGWAEDIYGTIQGNFTHESKNFLVYIRGAWNGANPKEVYGDPYTILNLDRDPAFIDPDLDQGTYLFEGERGGMFYARLNREATASGSEGNAKPVYQAIWVECPNNPVSNPGVQGQLNQPAPEQVMAGSSLNIPSSAAAMVHPTTSSTATAF